MSLLDGLLNLLFPRNLACCACGEPLEGEEDGFCRRCLQKVVFLRENLCPRCGRPLGSYPLVQCLCQTEDYAFSFCRAAALYQGDIKEWIHRFKYGKEKEMAYAFGILLYNTVMAENVFAGIDLLVPVPLHARRLSWRTFNQSALLARELGERWGRPVVESLLLRVRETPTQVGLSKDERAHNLQRAFQVQGNMARGRNILLIDDILTTGATANACTKALLDAGAAQVSVLTLARGI